MMNDADIKQFILDVMHEGKQRQVGDRHGKKRLRNNFSKKLMVFSCVIFAATWAISVASWFFNGSFPEELKVMATWLFGSTFAFYEAKACIENKAKLETTHPEDMHSEFI